MENKKPSFLEQEIQEYREEQIANQKSLEDLFVLEEIPQQVVKEQYTQLGDPKKRIYVAKEITHIPISDLIPNIRQSRIGYGGDNFTSPEIQELLKDKQVQDLKKDIAINGLLQPILVTAVKKREDYITPDGSTKKRTLQKYMVVSGHRRVLAHLALGLNKINALQMSFSGGSTAEDFEYEMSSKNLAENIKRKNLNPIEISNIVNYMAQKMTHKEIAQKLQMSLSSVKRYSTITQNLHHSIKEDLLHLQGNFELTMIYQISRLSPYKQKKLYQMFKNKDKDLKSALRELLKPSEQSKRKRIFTQIPTIHKQKHIKAFLQEHEEAFLEELNEFVKGFLKKNGFEQPNKSQNKKSKENPQKDTEKTNEESKKEPQEQQGTLL